jgi:hypothetical protein
MAPLGSTRDELRLGKVPNSIKETPNLKGRAEDTRKGEKGPPLRLDERERT